ncbi:hypothetical protein ABBQ32_003903 [Trebouxia sp. C0010 RCD-2024]
MQLVRESFGLQEHANHVGNKGSSAPYMDIFITPTPNRKHQHRLTTMLCDKREHPPLSALFIIKFSQISSNISDTAKYNIITSQFHRYRRTILWRKDLLYRLAALLEGFKQQAI